MLCSELSAAATAVKRRDAQARDGEEDCSHLKAAKGAELKEGKRRQGNHVSFFTLTHLRVNEDAIDGILVMPDRLLEGGDVVLSHADLEESRVLTALPEHQSESREAKAKKREKVVRARNPFRASQLMQPREQGSAKLTTRRRSELQSGPRIRPTERHHTRRDPASSPE